jgi:hypothetical protein
MGPWLANFIATYASRLSSPVAALPLLVVAGLIWLIYWHRRERKRGKPGVQNWHVLLTGLAGTWLFLTVTVASAAYWLMQTRTTVAAVDEGPLQWVSSFSKEGGGVGGQNVASLRFHGANTSKKPIELKKAELISLIDGSRLKLEIVAVDAQGNTKIVPIENVQLVPPGAPLELVAKFGPPDPATPGYILGLEPKAFLERWRKFSFNATDDTRSYQMEFNETAMMPFFQGKVGPRVSIKPDQQ